MADAYHNDFYDPCFKESTLSKKCLRESNYDKDLCTPFFENYRMCKKFWGEVQSLRRKKGISPTLPFPEERDAIKAKYKTTGRIPATAPVKTEEEN